MNEVFANIFFRLIYPVLVRIGLTPKPASRLLALRTLTLKTPDGSAFPLRPSWRRRARSPFFSPTAASPGDAEGGEVRRVFSISNETDCFQKTFGFAVSFASRRLAVFERAPRARRRGRRGSSKRRPETNPRRKLTGPPQPETGKKRGAGNQSDFRRLSFF
jgi:hypothetical protein